MTKTTSTSPVLWPAGRELPEGWSFTPFGKIAALTRRKEAVEPDKTYPLVGMRWYAKGPYIKERLPGTNIKASHLYKVAKGDFIYNRLFAWKGSFGVIDLDLSLIHISEPTRPY